ncbi:MAG: glycosyltransferase [bacterium]|nr:glycosyltransferase [bacterium]
MSKIAFFCIPAYGHTNPTLEVVKELISRGHEVHYYSYNMMKEKIEATGAVFISCDPYDIQMHLSPEDGKRVGKDLAFSTEILVNTTLALDEAVLEDMRKWKPDCIVGDSMATWGKLTAMKLEIPFVSSTTTFAFNKESAKVMDHGLGQLLGMLPSMLRANKYIKKLRDKGYPVKNVLSVISNDNNTNTIVYTSSQFQPFSESFSDKYVFVGPSIRNTEAKVTKTAEKLLYISLGTVINQNDSFYKNCIEAFGNTDLQVIMSVGNLTDIKALGDVPANIAVQESVDQIAVLQQADVFITHCGMNSVSEALYFKVPLVLFPQTNEQKGVANRVNELGAGAFLQENTVEKIKEAVHMVMDEPAYRKAATQISEGFRRSGGAKAAADKIEDTISTTRKIS